MQSAAGAVALVGRAALRVDIADESVLLVEEDGGAVGQYAVADRIAQLRIAGACVALTEAEISRSLRVEGRRLGDDADGADRRVLPQQRALWTSQDFHSIEIREVLVGHSRVREVHAVDQHADRGLQCVIAR